MLLTKYSDTRVAAGARAGFKFIADGLAREARFRA
jgi:hypothetical protein